MAESAKLDQILTKLGAIEAQTVRILMNEADMKAALDKIDVATTKIGDNLTVVSGVAGTISTEVDALVAALQNAGVPQSLIDQATALGTKADAVVAATDALVPVLQGIASKANNVVPIPVPPPPPPPPGA
jgi:phage-related protein